ncbi:hypothetical protein DX914_16285 [Lysobacter silvisoli]|uniref:Uncharacterized protein n=1 Tax=Lysobacter silvisoli TaxID=2293254 RepID=A0A371JY06_9GAMM|nr:hypothetical protein DX914_16285 [Lysobacter silvisoli]
MLTLAALPALAAPPAALTVDCQRPALPRQQALAQLTGIDNLGQAYAVRSRLMAQAARACQRTGTQQVRIVSQPAAAAAPPVAAR